MTTDATPFPVQEGYLQIPVPGIQYSAIRVPLDGTLERDNLWVEHAMFIATLAQKLYREAFPDVPQQEAPQRPAEPQQRPQGTRKANELDPNLVVRGNCPEHGTAARPSKLEYQEIELDDEGVEHYAKYWCSGQENGTGKTHSLYRRQLVR